MAPLSSDQLAALEGTLRCWETAETVGAVAVLIGVIGEYLAEFQKRLLRTPERIDRVGKYATLLLIAGLAVELVALVRTRSLSERIVEAERTARIAIESKLAKVRHETSLTRRWGKEERERHRQDVRDRAFFNQPRPPMIRDAAAVFARRLDGKPGTALIVYLDNPKDEEPLTLAVALATMLKANGWTVPPPEGAKEVSQWGLSIDAKRVEEHDWASSTSAQGALFASLADALTERRITGRGLDTSLPEDTFRIFIGKRG